MTTPTLVASGLAGNATDFARVVRDPSGAVRNVRGTASVTSGTAADAFIGLVPFQAGARFQLNDKSIHCGNWGAGTTTVNIGIIYDDNVTFTNDVDAWASASTAPQSGGFVTIDEIEGMTFVALGNGYLAAQILTAAADATANITFSVNVSYGS